MKKRILDKMEKEIIVAMQNLDFDTAYNLDNRIKEIRDEERTR